MRHTSLSGNFLPNRWRGVSKTTLLLVMTFVILSGCSSESLIGGTNADKYGVSETDVGTPVDYSAESFMDVGQKVKIWYLSYSNWNRYQVGLRGSDKQLQWHHINPKAVYLDEDIETSYIERLPDESTGFGQRQTYILHIKVGTPIQGGIISNGRSGNTQTTMIVGGDLEQESQ